MAPPLSAVENVITAAAGITAQTGAERPVHSMSASYRSALSPEALERKVYMLSLDRYVSEFNAVEVLDFGRFHCFQLLGVYSTQIVYALHWTPSSQVVVGIHLVSYNRQDQRSTLASLGTIIVKCTDTCSSIGMFSFVCPASDSTPNFIP